MENKTDIIFGVCARRPEPAVSLLPEQDQNSKPKRRFFGFEIDTMTFMLSSGMFSSYE